MGNLPSSEEDFFVEPSRQKTTTVEVTKEAHVVSSQMRGRRQVQEDIEAADASKLVSILKRDLIRPWVQLNYGPTVKSPDISLERPEEEDLKSFADAITPFVDRGMKVGVGAIRDKFNVPAPTADEEILQPSAKSGQNLPPAPGTPAANRAETKFEYHSNGLQPEKGTHAAFQGESPSAGRSAPPEEMANVLAATMSEAMDPIMAKIEAMVEAASSLEELREALLSAFPALDVDKMVDRLAEGLASAELGGRAALEEESG